MILHTNFVVLCPVCSTKFDANSHVAGVPQPLMHLDAGKNTVCQTEDDDCQFTDVAHINLVTCLTCLRIAAVEGLKP